MRYNNDMSKMRALSIIEEEGGKRVNMAHLVRSIVPARDQGDPIERISAIWTISKFLVNFFKNT
jgi:hypothetical protein